MILTLQNILIVGLGGFIGAILRYLLSGYAQHLSRVSFFPIGTIAVNVLGCLAIGFLSGLAQNLQVFSPHARLFLFIGILGSFTTFSTFGYETMALFRDGEVFLAFLNVSLQMVVCLGVTFIGFQLTSTA